MILLSWNCRGVGSPRTVRNLCLLVKENNLDILFLIEIKCNKVKLEFLRVRLGYVGLLVVDAVRRNGGLALMWKEESILEI
jgi:exonuclease III